MKYDTGRKYSFGNKKLQDSLVVKVRQIFFLKKTKILAL